ncbi:MAG: sugar ABC transporter substrate-binding protein [Pseudoflavonifractor sp.]|nr:sugar ABC transporter substrate-binding protein [Pseudoflavonifractor sp.]
MKKAISLLLAAVMAVTCLAGCGTPSSPSTDSDISSSGTPSTSSKELEGEITFWHSFTQGPRLETIQAAADAFMKDNPKVKINIETYSWADFYTKWTTGLASGNVPDMSSAVAIQVVEMIDADAILPMDNLVDKIGRDNFYEKALTEMTAEDGHVYGVPLYSNTEAMWYRKDLMEKYNLEVPETWEEMYEAAKIITEGEGGNVYGAAMPMGTNDMLATRWLHLYVRSAGDTLITEDGKANLTSPTAIDGINYWVKVFNDCSPADAMNYNTLDEATMYYQGKLAFDFNTGFHISGVEANTPELLQYVDCAPIPRVNKDDPAVGCETNNTPLVIWKNSKHPEICEAFIEYFYEPERYVDFLLSVPVGMMPALKGVTETEKYQSNQIVQDFQHANEVLYQMLDGSTSIGFEYGPRAEAGMLTSQRVIEEMFQDIIMNGTDVEVAAKAAEDKLNDLFETVG